MRMIAPTPAVESIESLYRNHREGLRNWLYYKLRNSGQAADLVQDTFLRLMARQAAVPSFIADLREPLAFLRSIANGLVIDHWRRQALEQAYLETLAALPEPTAPSAEERAAMLQTLEQISALLDGFKPRVRTAFLLAQLEGLGHAEIARQMDVSLRTVERWLADALLQCHRVLRQEPWAATARTPAR